MKYGYRFKRRSTYSKSSRRPGRSRFFRRRNTGRYGKWRVRGGGYKLARKSYVATKRLRRFVRKGFRQRPVLKYYRQLKQNIAKTEGFPSDAWKFPHKLTTGVEPQGYNPNYDDCTFWRYPAAFVTLSFLYNDFFNFLRVRPAQDLNIADTQDNLSSTINRRIHYIMMYKCSLQFEIMYNPICHYLVINTRDGATHQNCLWPVYSDMIVEIRQWKRTPRYQFGPYSTLFGQIENESQDNPLTDFNNESPFPKGNDDYIQFRNNYALINPFDLTSASLPEQKKIWKCVRRKIIRFKAPSDSIINRYQYQQAGEPTETDNTSSFVPPAIGNGTTTFDTAGHTQSRSVLFNLYKNTRIRLPAALTARDITNAGNWNLENTPTTTYGQSQLVDIRQRYYFSIRVCRTALTGDRIWHPIVGVQPLDPNTKATYERSFLPQIVLTLRTLHQSNI
jgi:hypothetical protein